MNRHKTKQLKRTLLIKTPDVLLVIKNEIKDTSKMTAQSVWRTFKRLYKNGKISKKLLIK